MRSLPPVSHEQVFAVKCFLVQGHGTSIPTGVTASDGTPTGVDDEQVFACLPPLW